MESHLEKSLFFKVRKVTRYVSIYGPSRTWIKVKGQYHLEKKDEFGGSTWKNHACSTEEHSDRFVGIVGCGNFSYTAIAYYLRQTAPKFLRATFDSDRTRALSLCRDFGGTYAADNFETLLADDKIRLIYIASNHRSHAEYAVRALNAGKHVHIEKPHVVTLDQLQRLIEAQRRNPQCMVFLGFNRPASKIFGRLNHELRGQSGPLMVNWFVAGHHIPDDHWYFSEEEGGRILGNLCHWTDLTLQMVGVDKAFPCRIIAASAPMAKSDFSISITFGDCSVAGITFSAKGHTFEGVRETLNAHKGDVLIAMSDFRDLRIDRGAHKRKIRSLFRDHGHRANIENSFVSVRANDRTNSVPLRYVEATALLFLAVKKAVDSGQPVDLEMPPEAPVS